MPFSANIYACEKYLNLDLIEIFFNNVQIVAVSNPNAVLFNRHIERIMSMCGLVVAVTTAQRQRMIVGEHV